MLKPETMFKQAMVDEWTAAVVEEILKRLADQRKPFKYVGELPLSDADPWGPDQTLGGGGPSPPVLGSDAGSERRARPRWG